ncbi:uncharacterized protein AC631_03741 [Debaryomyces fabryi]|uniref:DHHA2 domain-containing protein n=1 Tax=Debaryomyces fabryi TaxID=58627 RepID=A0A0V1PW77_9ASCO|nr:uncharacterized protein AC631_03741 [Debaryomyces fabryi]KSA00510.1 hypothetical protein AC631_03741 [Debaryomyces fabryi]CUM45583.1 unnamed protein product [Debaryomyces fabryi]
MSLRSYLVTLKKQLESNSIKTPLRFVTGNQSADLDSVISAITFAYFNYKRDESLLIPLINISRNDFKLRRDIVTLLNSYSITEDSLYFIEDFKRITASDAPIELTLVDHCNVQGDIFTEYISEGKLEVVGIIDHHQDESVFLNANPRIIHSNGSCSSLVFNYWYDQFSNKDIFYEKNNEVVPLLLGSLLIDTSNMTQKVEGGDVIAFSEYQNILQKNENLLKGLNEYACQSTDNIEKLLKGYYKQIKKAKKDMKGFSFYDILKKDYKQFKFISKSDVSTTVGFSSIGKSFYWLFSNYSKEEISETFNKIMKDLNLDLLVMTPSYTRQENDQYAREFGYTFNSKNSRKEILLQLAELAKDELKLNSDTYKLENFDNYLANLANNQEFKVYNQNNLAASRKQIVPVVKNILENN